MSDERIRVKKEMSKISRKLFNKNSKTIDKIISLYIDGFFDCLNMINKMLKEADSQ